MGGQELSAYRFVLEAVVGLRVADGYGETAHGDVPYFDVDDFTKVRAFPSSPRLNVPAQRPGVARSQHGNGGVGIFAVRN